MDDGQVLIINKTVRTGKTIEHPGTIIVLGDVNPSANIVAGGNIIVLGTAAGSLTAGAIIGQSATISANKFAAPYIKIGQFISKEVCTSDVPTFISALTGEMAMTTIHNK